MLTIFCAEDDVQVIFNERLSHCNNFKGLIIIKIFFFSHPFGLPGVVLRGNDNAPSGLEVWRRYSELRALLPEYSLG
jgi:hypothetical protein